VTITAPTTASTYVTLNPTVDLGGSSSDNVGVAGITWSNGGHGSGGSVGGSLDPWTLAGIALNAGATSSR